MIFWFYNIVRKGNSMIEIIVTAIVIYLILKFDSKGKENYHAYADMPEYTKLTYDEWYSLEYNDKPLELTKEEWEELRLKPKLTKKEYEEEKNWDFANASF